MDKINCSIVGNYSEKIILRDILYGLKYLGVCTFLICDLQPKLLNALWGSWNYISLSDY